MHRLRLFGILLFLSIIGGATIAYMSRSVLLNPFGSRAAQVPIQITAAPSSLIMQKGTESDITLLLKPGESGATISGFDLSFLAQGQVSIASISTPTVFPTGDSGVFTQIVKQVGAHVARISYVSTLPKSSLPQAVTVIISLRAEQAGEGNFSVDVAQSQIVGEIAGSEYQISQVSPVSVVVGESSGFSVGGNSQAVVLDIRARMSGVTAKPEEERASQEVEVEVMSAEGGTSVYNLSFTAQEDGVWSGSFEIDDPPGEGYSVGVIGPRHGAKLFCTIPTIAESSDCGGAITLTTGVNTLDFTATPLPAGDVSGAGGRDGVVDSADAAYVLELLGASDPASIEAADVNFDGVVDTQDYALVIRTIATGE